MSKWGNVFIREDENWNKYYCRDIDIDNERIYLKKINKRLDQSLLEANKRIRKYKEIIEDLRVENRRLNKKLKLYINMIREIEED